MVVIVTLEYVDAGTEDPLKPSFWAPSFPSLQDMYRNTSPYIQ